MLLRVALLAGALVGAVDTLVLRGTPQLLAGDLLRSSITSRDAPEYLQAPRSGTLTQVALSGDWLTHQARVEALVDLVELAVLVREEATLAIDANQGRVEALAGLAPVKVDATSADGFFW